MRDAVRGWTCQRDVPERRARTDHGLAGSWSKVSPSDLVAYRTMARMLADAGISSAEAAPLWAWAGSATPRAVEQRLTSLLSESELELDQYVVEFRAPRGQVLRTDYGAWCDYYFSTFDASVTPLAPPGAHPTGDQLTLGRLRAEWITRVTRLDTSRWASA